MRLVPFLTAVVVVVALYFAVFQRDALLAFAKADAQSPPPDAEPADRTDAADSSIEGLIRVVAMQSRAREIDNAVLLRGQTRAVRQVEVRAETTATVISEPMRKGSFVEAGEMLCQLDPGTRPAQLAEMKARKLEAESRVPEAEARLEEAHSRLAEARINWRAADKLMKGGYASETRLVATEAAVQAAEAGIASAESGLEATRAGIEAASAAVAAAEREIERLTIRAPFSGLLESDTAELGSLMQPGALCATVIQLNPIKLVGFVPETEVDRIEVGARAGAELTTGRRVEGQVTFLSRSADEATRTFEVEITVANPDLRIRDGQTATIAIGAEGAKAHLLPQSALTLNNDGQLGVRTVGQDGLVAFNPVQMLRDTTSGVWLGGLPETVDVIVVGQDFVTEGVRVAATYREALK